MTGDAGAGDRSQEGTGAGPFAGRTYEQLVAELEALTDRMASGDLGIEEAADLYEQARALHDAAAERLARVQARIDALATDGPPVPVEGRPVV